MYHLSAQGVDEGMINVHVVVVVVGVYFRQNMQLVQPCVQTTKLQ